MIHASFYLHPVQICHNPETLGKLLPELSAEQSLSILLQDRAQSQSLFSFVMVKQNNGSAEAVRPKSHHHGFFHLTSAKINFEALSPSCFQLDLGVSLQLEYHPLHWNLYYITLI